MRRRPAPMPGLPITDDPDALTREALRLNLRYLEEIVEAYGFCPYAQKARLEGRVWRRAVLEGEDGSGGALGWEARARQGPTHDLAPALRVIDEYEAAPAADLEVGLLVFPRFEGELGAFTRFAARLYAAYVSQRGLDRAFVDAVFHPGYPLVTRRPRALIGFIRRSPDPMLQYTRQSALEGVRRSLPAGPIAGGVGIRTDPVSAVVERIADRNFRVVTEELGAAHLEGLQRSLIRDRNRAYARFGLPPRPLPQSTGSTEIPVR